MTLLASRLGNAIKAAFVANGAMDNAACASLSLAIGTAIVVEFTTNAVVPVPALGLVAPPPSGPVTGAASGTIT